MKKAISIILIISLSVICTGIFFPKGYAAGNSIPALEYAVFTDGKIQLKPDAVIKGDARTNSGELVEINKWSCKIEGKLYVGPGYKPDFDKENVTEGVHQLESDIFYPMPDFISISADFTNADILDVGQRPDQKYTISNAEQDSYFKSLTVSSAGKLTIDTGRKGNVKKIYVETLNISEGQVILAGEGKLLIFAQKIHTIAGSCIVNTSTQKERLHLFVEGEDTINISGDARFYGSIYAPNASVALGGSAEVHGNIIAGGDKYDMVGNCHVINGVVYAPRAAASLSGTVTITGAAVFKELSASGGGTQIVFAPVDFNIPGGFLTEPPLVPETITIEVKEDAFICSAKWNTNFGKEKTLEIKKQEKKENNIRKVYLKFDLTDLQISSVQNAKLKLYSTAADSVDIAVYETSNNWTETTITWNNAPAFGDKITSAVVAGSKQYHEWDITQYIRSQLQTGNNIIGIGMYVDDDYNGNSSNKKFNSREAKDNHPLLEITAIMGDPGYSSDELIVDNDNANNEGKGTCYFSDEWVSSTSVAGQYYLNDYAHDGNAGADPSKWAKWVPIIPESGEYYVYMMWSSHPNRPDNAPVEIKWANGLDTSISVNQQKNGGEWVYLGEYYLTKGEDCYVKILASDEGYTIADAVKFVRVSPDVPIDDKNIDLKDGVSSNRVDTNSGGINLYVSGEVITYQLILTNRKDLENVKLELEFVSDKENLRFITYRPDVSSYCYIKAEEGTVYNGVETDPTNVNSGLEVLGYWYDSSVSDTKILRAGEPSQLIYKIRVASKDRQQTIARLTNTIRLTYDGKNDERITIIKKLPVDVYMSLPGLS